MTTITGFDTFDVRFPTSRTLAGSDAMNPQRGGEITADTSYLSTPIPDELWGELEALLHDREGFGTAESTKFFVITEFRGYVRL
jgi:hypothetical protein